MKDLITLFSSPPDLDVCLSYTKLVLPSAMFIPHHQID